MSSQDQPTNICLDLPYSIEEIENCFIAMSDGCRIAARLWLPDNARKKPVPAILEYIPYRKRDFMRARDEPIHRYFAGHGYVSVRADVRGTGDSDGVLSDEYSLQEHLDAVAIIAWIAQQEWCDGNVGMMGISWGGFNALQVAALQPPELKAVISLCSTDDRYADDAHYMGGCLLNENLQWGSILMTYAVLPPDPKIVGERWKEMWQERIGHAVAYPAVWMQHPWRDDYWKHGSICEDFSAVRCPVYAIGGWADGYSNAVPRLLSGLTSPRKGLIGPWAHTFPHIGVPGPAIGFLQEALRWWDQWLLQKDTGIMREPMLRVWMQDSVEPQPQYETRPGRWVAESSWPSPRIQWKIWHMNANGLHDHVESETEISLSSPQTTGLVAGEWCAFGADGEMPLDQRVDDGRSLCFDSNPLSEDLEILGAPSVELTLVCNVSQALIAVRLNDLAEDGTSTRVSYGLLNLAHRQSHESPSPLVPGETYCITIQLNDIAHRFPTGHQLRIAVATSYWPIVWPAPQSATLTLTTGKCRVLLPVRPADPADLTLTPFGTAEMATGSSHVPLRPLPFQRTSELDLASNEIVYTLSSDGGEFGGHELAHLAPIDMDLGYKYMKRHRIADTDPLSAKSEITQTISMRRGAWAVRVESHTRLQCTLNSCHFHALIDIYEGDSVVQNCQWNIEIPRKYF